MSQTEEALFDIALACYDSAVERDAMMERMARGQAISDFEEDLIRKIEDPIIRGIGLAHTKCELDYANAVETGYIELEQRPQPMLNGRYIGDCINEAREDCGYFSLSNFAMYCDMISLQHVLVVYERFNRLLPLIEERKENPLFTDVQLIAVALDMPLNELINYKRKEEENDNDEN